MKYHSKDAIIKYKLKQRFIESIGEIMTKREFMEKVIAMENASEEMKEFATQEIAKLDRANTNRKPDKRQEENEMLTTEVLKVVTDEPLQAKEITAKLENFDSEFPITTNRVSALLRKLVLANKVEKIAINSKVNAYRLKSE